MYEPKIGDYVIGNKTIYEIVGIRPRSFVDAETQFHTTYTIQEMADPGDQLEVMFHGTGISIYHVFEGYTLQDLRHLGQIIPKEEASKAIEVLFSK